MSDHVVTQLARPDASLLSTFPAPGEPPVIFTCHATSSLDPGVAVPIPTFPVIKSMVNGLVGTIVVLFASVE